MQKIPHKVIQAYDAGVAYSNVSEREVERGNTTSTLTTSGAAIMTGGPPCR